MVAEELSFGSKKFILSRAAARLVKYSNDYIGELCRSGKVEARQVGRLWYVEESSLLAHKRENGKQGFGASKHREKRALYKETPAVRAQFKAASPAPAKGVQIFDGKKFVSGRIATHLTGYSNDYIGELCRSGKVEAFRKGRLWYLERDSLITHKKTHGKQGFGSNKIKEAREHEKEYKERHSDILKNVGMSSSMFPSPYFSKVAALALCLGLLFVGYQAYLGAMRFSTFDEVMRGVVATEESRRAHTALSLASLGEGVGSAFRKAGDALADLLFGDFEYTLVVSAPSGEDTKLLIEELARVKEKLGKLENAGAPAPVVAAPPSSGTTVIERVVSGVTKSELAADLSIMVNALRAEIYRVAATASSDNTATYFAVAATNNIDKLKNVAVSGATITGSTFAGTSVTADQGTFDSLAVTGSLSGATSFSAGTSTITNLAVTNTSTSTFAGPLTVAGAFSAQSGLFTISGTTTAENQLIAALVPTQAHTFGTWAPNVANSNVGNATFYVNPASAAADTNLLGLAVGGAVKFLVDAEGDVFVNSLTSVGETTLSTTTASSFTVENSLTVGDSVNDTFTLNAGNLVYNNYATSTLKNGVLNAFSFATSSTTMTPHLSFDTLNDRVGVGTTSPYAKLSIARTTGNLSNPTVQIGSTFGGITMYSDDYNNQIVLNGQYGNTLSLWNQDAGQAVIQSNDLLHVRAESYIDFQTNNTVERMRIDAAGNVGIGTTSPWAQLSVNPNGITGPSFVVGSSTATNFVVTNGGNVGVGTAIPSRKMHIVDGTTYPNFGEGEQLRLDGSTTAGANMGFYTSLGGARRNWLIGTDVATAGDFGFVRSASAGAAPTVLSLVITNAGSVGIGTTSPIGRLSITGSGASTGYAFVIADSNNLQRFTVLDNGTALLSGNSSDRGNTYTSANSINGQYDANTNGIFYINYTGYQAGTTQFRDTQISNGKAGNVAFFQGSTGNVGIGTTTPWAQLSVNPNGVTGPSFVVGSSTATNFVVTNAGKVGVGNISPQALLHVGVGTDTPLIGEKTVYVSDAGATNLAIRDSNSNAELLNYVYSGGGIIGTATNHDFTIRSNNANRIAVTAAGATYITGGSGQLPLTVYSSGGVGYNVLSYFSNTDTGGGSFQVTSFHTVSGNAAIGDTLLTNQVGNLMISPNVATKDIKFIGGLWTNAPAMVIKDGGNVGIGTTTPWAQLSVNPNGVTGPAFVVGSSTATNFIVTNGGNVGIGVVATSAKLHVEGANSGSRLSLLRLSNTGSGVGTAPSLGFSYGQDSGDAAYIAATYLSDGPSLQFATDASGGINPTVKAVINGNGNFGIGTSSASTALDIWGGNSGDQIRLNTAGGATNPKYKIGRNSTTGYLDFTGLETGFVGYTFSNGSVGIGTTSPWGRLSVEHSGGKGLVVSQTNSGFAAEEIVRIQTASLLNPTSVGVFNIASSTGGTDSSLFYVRGDGNVGIGTTSPRTLFEVSGSRQGILNNIGQLFITGYADHSYIQVMTTDPANMEQGIQFIGQKKDISNPDWGIKMSAASSNLTITSSSTVAMTMAPNGSVGIGITNPQHSRLNIIATGTSASGAISKALVLETSASSYPTFPGTGVALTFSTPSSIAAGLDIGHRLVGQYVADTYNGPTDLYIQRSTDTGVWTTDVAFGRTGLVGIGTSSPVNGKLEVLADMNTALALRRASAADYTGIRIFNDQNSTSRALEIDYSGSSYASSLLSGGPTGESASIGTTGAYPLAFGTNNTVRMTITSDGNVGIGTTTPRGLLDIYNGKLVFSDADVNGEMLTHIGSYARIEPLSGTAGGMYFQGESDTDAAGMLLAAQIGSTDPADTTPAIYVSGSKWDGSGTGGQALASTETVFRVDNYLTTGLVTVLGSGNVGIGTVNPASTKLDVQTSGATNAWVGVGQSGTGSAGLILDAGGGDYAGTDYVILAQNDDLTADLYTSTNGGVLRLGSKGATGSLVIDSGLVGIGTTTPVSTLSVQGSLCVRDTGSCGTTAGTIYATNATVVDIDLAENYPTADMTLQAGELVAVDMENSEHVKRAFVGDTVLGVVSTKPGLLLGREATSSKPIALAGRVPVKVTTEGGAVRKGDRLALSSIPGLGMKATTSGYSIGIALEDFDPDNLQPTTYNSDIQQIAVNGQTYSQGKIIAFVNLSYAVLDPNASLAAQPSSADPAGPWMVDSGGSIITVRFLADVSLEGHALLDVGRITGFGGKWAIDEEGRFLAKEITTEKLKITSRNGFTIFDEDTAEPMCVKSKSGSLTLVSGECAVPAASSPVASTGFDVPLVPASTSTEATTTPLETATAPTGQADTSTTATSADSGSNNSDGTTDTASIPDATTGQAPVSATETSTPIGITGEGTASTTTTI